MPVSRTSAASAGSRAAALFTAASLSLSLLSAPARAESWPDRVDATYKIAFNGIEIGKFDFQAEIAGNTYTAQGDAKISALLGAFKWQGATRASGHVGVQTPKPAGYTFDYRGTGKDGSIKMGFQNGSVTNVTALPQKPPSPGTIPLKEQHLAGVLDPLSAVLALSRSPNQNPCGRKIAVFDGKQRFDLSLTYVRQQAVAETRPSGQPGVAFVCKVKYHPIAGHKMNEETRHMAHNDGIEVSFRPVPSAALFVPHTISIATVAGTATLTAERINIQTRREQIALSH